MWTPKRILLLFGGFGLFIVSYALYSFFLGGINGMPAIPEPMLPVPELAGADEKDTGGGGVPEPGADRRLRMSFGNDCPELGRTIRVEVRSRNMCLAADNLTFEPDGRVKLTPFSIALFGKERKGETVAEINTVRSDEAYLTFDRPISNMAEINSRKITAAELRGPITIINNRRTDAKNDDLELHVTNGPLQYNELRKQIWTDGIVKMLDTQTQPQPTKITAKGMDIFLTKEAQPLTNSKAARAGKVSQDKVAGVDSIVLRANVEMYLYVDARSGFLAGVESQPGKAPAKTAVKNDKKAVEERSPVVIKTQGPFKYDTHKDEAVFESAGKIADTTPGLHPGQVIVTRIHDQSAAGKGNKLYDSIVCDLLTLKFRAKQADPAAPAPTAQQAQNNTNKEIVSAEATARPGNQVVLSMDSEHLNAEGDVLRFEAAAPGRGPKTVLAGKPLNAVKDAHRIRAAELHLVGNDAKGVGQNAFAKGPGQIDLLDRNLASKVHQYHILFRESMHVTKDKEGEKLLDQLSFVGDAAFIDDEHKQEMRGEKVVVWLEPAQRQDPAAQKNAGSVPAVNAPRQQPHKIECTKNVTVRAPELKVDNCEHLLLLFREGTPTLPDSLPQVAAKTPAPTGAVLPPASATQPTNPFGLDRGKDDKKERKALEIKARRLTAYMVREGAKNELRDLHTEGNVHVHQDGNTPKDKGVDIRGETLNLERRQGGDILYVYCSAQEPAQMQLGELFLAGPKITINQVENIAVVEGVGVMHMPSNASLAGNAPSSSASASKNGTRLTVHWNKDMFFNGKDADFRGGVQAYQDDGSVRCEIMQVALDRTVSFKEGQKSNQGAKVEKLLCDRKVYTVDTKRTPDKQLVRYERLQSLQLTMENTTGMTNAQGPGTVTLMQYGSGAGNEMVGKPDGKQADKRLYVTRVDFASWMHVPSTKDKAKICKFSGNVEVRHGPSDDPDIAIDAARLPKEWLYLRCDYLDTYQKQHENGTSHQEMWGRGNVQFQTGEYSGQANLLKYDQRQETIIFEGSETRHATLYRQVGGPGTAPQEIKGRRILYNRKTGLFTLDGIESIQTGQ